MIGAPFGGTCTAPHGTPLVSVSPPRPSGSGGPSRRMPTRSAAVETDHDSATRASSPADGPATTRSTVTGCGRPATRLAPPAAASGAIGTATAGCLRDADLAPGGLDRTMSP